MAKIWCEECKGTGEIPGQNLLAVIKRLCKTCHGNGYTEADVVEVDKVREWAMYKTPTVDSVIEILGYNKMIIDLVTKLNELYQEGETNV